MSFHQSLLAFLQNPARSNRATAKEFGIARPTARRRRGVLQNALDQAGGAADPVAVVQKLVASYRTWGDRVRPDFEAVDAALNRGESLRSAWRTYSKQAGKRALKLAQFASLCRRQRGGRSLVCVRRRPGGETGTTRIASVSKSTRQRGRGEVRS
jgi:CelD/BcsL family acetyltransferase involved in cellulose biosynthesis